MNKNIIRWISESFHVTNIVSTIYNKCNSEVVDRIKKSEDNLAENEKRQESRLFTVYVKI